MLDEVERESKKKTYVVEQRSPRSELAAVAIVSLLFGALIALQVVNNLELRGLERKIDQCLSR